MTRDDRMKMHSERAMQELDCALKAGSEKVARAHFSLSALHLESLRALQSASPEPLAGVHGH